VKTSEVIRKSLEKYSLIFLLFPKLHENLQSKDLQALCKGPTGRGGGHVPNFILDGQPV
jgi:hypothetical protein